MKQLNIFLGLLFALPLAASTCSTPLIDDITHQGARIQWTSSGTATSQRVLYGTTTAYGSTQGVISPSVATVPTLQGLGISGLEPNTTYHVNAQSFDGGAWCTAPDVTFNTLPLPNPHPAKPIPPKVFDTTTVPTITGTTWTVGGNCATFQDCLNAAQPGDGIVIPAGTAVTPGSANGSTFSTPTPPDAKATSSISTTTGVFTTSSPHGYSEGQPVRVGGYTPTPFNGGYSYYVRNPTASTFQLSATPAGSVVVPTDAGLAHPLVIAWPPPDQRYIVIRTSTPDSQLPPPGVRLDPAIYGSRLAMLQNTAPGSIFPIISFSGLAHHYWFIGIELTTGSSTTAGQSTDPLSFYNLIHTNSQTSNIVFDRCYVHGPGFPNRIRSGWTYMDGENIALINSYADNLTYWRPFKIGLPVTVTAPSQMTIGPGTFHIGNKNCTNSSTVTLSVINGGNVSGGGVLYYDMSCQLTANLPTGVSATGNGITVINSASPNFPTDANGRRAAGMMAQIGISAGAFTGVGDIPSYSYSGENTEGTTGFQSSTGPGPAKLENNYIEGTGIPVFWSDDSVMNGGCFAFCKLLYPPGDITIRRNTVTTLLTHMAGGPLSDGRAYAHRNNLEWKTGNRILIEGNIVSNSWHEVVQGPALIIFGAASNTPAGLSTLNGIADVEVRYNTFVGNAELRVLSAHASNGVNQTVGTKRAWFHDNLSFSNNGYLRASAQYDGSASTGAGTGQYLSLQLGVEDFVDEHNTVFDSRGRYPVIAQLIAAIGDGQNMRNNILSTSNDASANPYNFIDTLGTSGGQGSPTVPNYGGFVGTNLLNVQPRSIWDRNVILGAYNNSGPAGSETDLSQSQVDQWASTFPPSPQTIWPSGASLASRVASVGWFNTALNNFRLTSSSPYVSGGALRATDGLDVGADIDALEAAQGKVSNVRAFTVTSHAATIGFLAPDSFGCGIDWTSNAWASFTRVPNPGGARVQNVTLSSLPGGTTISYRVNCAVMQPTGSFVTP